jgi:hypothetical protein
MGSLFKKIKQVWRGNQLITVQVPGLEGGAGDILKSLAEKIGVKPCEACEKRRQALNKRLKLK